MKRKPGWVKNLQDANEKAKDLLVKGGANVKEKTVGFDKEFGVSDTVKDLNGKLGISSATKSGFAKAEEAGREIISSDAYKAFESGAASAFQKTKKTVIKPAGEYLESSGAAGALRKTAVAAGALYGKTRTFIKPYFAPETPEELLRKTREELLYINACILQVSRDEAEKLANKFGAAIASKIAGTASAGVLLTMASTFGSASTGTAISSLYGAAHANASLAWVGGLFGGGMAAGAVVTSGVAVVVGVGMYKLMGSKARTFEELSDVEKQIVESSGFLIAAINDLIKNPALNLEMNDAESFLQNTLRPFYTMLLENADAISRNLDGKNALAFKQHALIDFKGTVIDGFEHYLEEEMRERRKRYPEFAIAGVIYALLTNSVVDSSLESQTALEAIRRVNGDWSDLSENKLSELLSEYSAKRLEGVANNAKGMYHEMLFVKNYNENHIDTYAEMHEATNHPGSDVVIRSSDAHEIVDEYQLKATGSEHIVREHFQRYPDIEMLATSETAAGVHGAESSGFSNEELTAKMDDVIGDVADNSIEYRVGESAGFAGLAAAALEANRIMEGKQPWSEAGLNVVKSMSVAAGSTALAAGLFAS